MAVARTARYAAVAAVAVGMCACSSTAGGATRSGTVEVHVGLFGGPLTASGVMAASGNPAPGVTVRIVAADGRVHTASTDSTGAAAFVVQPGHYTVSSTSCGAGQHVVQVTSGTTSRVSIHCDVR